MRLRSASYLAWLLAAFGVMSLWTPYAAAADRMGSLEILGDASRADAISSSLDYLSNCEWEHIINNGGLHEIIISRKHLDKRTINGHVYYDMAWSHKGTHALVIDRDYADNKVVVLHEMGHWFAWDVIRTKYADAWRDAVALDVKEIKQAHPDVFGADTRHARDNDYLEDAGEAAAEEFAYIKLGPQYYKYDKRDMPMFVHSLAMLKEILQKECEQSASQ